MYDEIERAAERIQRLAVRYEINPFVALNDWLIDDLAAVVAERYGQYAMLVVTTPNLTARLEQRLAHEGGRVGDLPPSRTP